MKSKIIFFAVFIFSIIFCFFGLLFWYVYPIKYKEHIIEYSAKYKISANLVASVICVESKFREDVKSQSGACGLMQIMPNTFNWVCNQLQIDVNSSDIFDPETNIKAGCFYLNYLFNKYGNSTYVLACYNAGEGIVSLWGTPDDFDVNDIQYPETKNYVKKVNSLLWLYNSRLNN